MKVQEEAQWKIDKLREAICKSSDIKDEIKNLLGEVTIDFGAEVRTVSRDNIFRIYQARLSLLESKGKWNESFANLLKKLKDVDNSFRLVITVLRYEDKIYGVFTDKDYEECFGVIY
ncbi:MAG: hypothetical protein JWQ57_666 [Mucilaginibacter sp.]|nr:hypothetical protein [Mucilaginibacter sp.]